jgi:hypothetical protein
VPHSPGKEQHDGSPATHEAPELAAQTYLEASGVVVGLLGGGRCGSTCEAHTEAQPQLTHAGRAVGRLARRRPARRVAVAATRGR